MGRCIAYNDGLFIEWSTVVDAPVTFGMTEAELRDHIGRRYGEEGLEVADARIERAKRLGTSWIGRDENFDELVSYNRAGPNETCLSKDQLVRIYMVEKRDPDPARPEDMGKEWEDKDRDSDGNPKGGDYRLRAKP